MADIDWLLERVEAAPNGPGVAAFFDFDGTLIDGYSAAAFFKHRLKTGDVGLRELINSVAEVVNIEKRGHSIDELMHLGVQAQAGELASDVDEWARTIFAKRIEGMLFPQARALIEAHQEKGHTVVVASSATGAQIRATADDLGIPNVICTEIEIDENGYITGELASPIRWGQGKADGVGEFAESWGIKMDDSFAYGNGGEDVAFLGTVGNPCALNPDADLLESARAREWPVAYLTREPSTTPLDLVRSGLAFGALASSVAGGGTIALLRRNRTEGANFLAGPGCDATLAASGVKLNVVGGVNAWVERPAIFLYNHQSQLDVFVVGAVVRRDLTAVAKKELKKQPFFRVMGYLGDVAYIDRANHAKAVEQLAPVVETLKGGKSIMIAPEGTRAPTPGVLPFKKGAFHMANQAGVPLIPIIMRNCAELMPAHSYVIHPGTVDVAVLPPIHTEDWDFANLDEHVDEVRQQFVDTLTSWPRDQVS
jgi:putative phosphoserine phosphatase/1-acylglycerol-3-phosphate O-acyltransferase